jgi:hypothetical protein
VGVERGQALLWRGAGSAGRGLQQGQGVEDGVVLHHLLAQQPVHDAGVGFEQRALFVDGLAGDHHRADGGKHHATEPPPLQ